MITTAARSCKWLRKLDYDAEVVEHRRGSFMRKDLFNIADVLAFKKGQGILLVQAYDKYRVKEHENLNAKNPVISRWLHAGGRFSHHIWHYHVKNGKRRWQLETKEIKNAEASLKLP